jgi:hypothetical protein
MAMTPRIASSTLLPNTWYHFVGVVRTNGNTGYLNGQEMTWRHYNLGSNASYTNFFTSVTVRECLALAYGRYGQQDPFYYGPCTISDVQIYSRPLSAGEIRQLYLDVNDAGVFRYNWQVLSAGGGLVLTWPSDTNHTYTILQTGAPAPVNWVPVTDFQDMPASPPINCSTVRVDVTGSAFYRIQATSHGP